VRRKSGRRGHHRDVDLGDDGSGRHAQRIWPEELKQPITALQYPVLRTVEHARAIDQRALGEVTIVDKATRPPRSAAAPPMGRVIAARFLEPLAEARRDEFSAALTTVAAHARREFLQTHGQRREGLTPSA
jgi:hypothetical protein